MQDENGNVMTEKQIISEAMDLMSNVTALLFETKSPEGHAAAFMADNLLKYLQVIYRDDNVLLATCDYTAYEEGYQNKIKNSLTLVKDDLK